MSNLFLPETRRGKNILSNHLRFNIKFSNDNIIGFENKRMWIGIIRQLYIFPPKCHFQIACYLWMVYRIVLSTYNNQRVGGAIPTSEHAYTCTPLDKIILSTIVSRNEYLAGIYSLNCFKFSAEAAGVKARVMILSALSGIVLV